MVSDGKNVAEREAAAPALYSTGNPVPGSGYLSIATASSPCCEIYGELFPQTAQPSSIFSFDAGFNSVSATGQTYTLNTVQQGSYMLTKGASKFGSGLSNSYTIA